MMIHTNDIKKSLNADTSYWQYFKGLDLYRTEMAYMAFAAQPFCRSATGFSPTYFFVQVGLPITISFEMSVGGLGLTSLGTIVS